jgi:hypothetical protein
MDPRTRVHEHHHLHGGVVIFEEKLFIGCDVVYNLYGCTWCKSCMQPQASIGIVFFLLCKLILPSRLDNRLNKFQGTSHDAKYLPSRCHLEVNTNTCFRIQYISEF